MLLNEAEVLSAIEAADAAQAARTTAISAHERKAHTGGREAIPAHLRRKEVVHDLPNEQKHCEHEGMCWAMDRIGQEIQQVVDETDGMRELSLDQSTRGRHALGIGVREFHDLRGVAHGRQGIAQLVRQTEGMAAGVLSPKSSPTSTPRSCSRSYACSSQAGLPNGNTAR